MYVLCVANCWKKKPNIHIMYTNQNIWIKGDITLVQCKLHGFFVQRHTTLMDFVHYLWITATLFQVRLCSSDNFTVRNFWSNKRWTLVINNNLSMCTTCKCVFLFAPAHKVAPKCFAHPIQTNPQSHKTLAPKYFSLSLSLSIYNLRVYKKTTYK